VLRRCKLLARPASSTAVVLGVGVLTLVLASCASGQTPADPEVFVYRNVQYEMDAYSVTFGGDAIGTARRGMFDAYLANTTEGRARAAGAKDAEEAWKSLSWEEKTTFLANTAALHRLATEAGVSLLDWVLSLEQIHGETSLLEGRRYSNNEAFRLYVRLSPSAIVHLENGSGTFRNACTADTLPYDGLGSTHPDFCGTGSFDFERKTDNHPNLQFNVSRDTGCADVDIDYRPGLLHITRDNSNVLASRQILKFEQEYCDPGFRLKP